MTVTILDDIWDGLRPFGETIYKRVDDIHPLDIYLGRELSGERLLILISDQEPSQFPSGQSINIIVMKRNDGRWAVVIKLINKELKRIFSQLCDDLIESSRDCDDKISGASTILARYLHWKKLLDRGFTGILDERSLRGLVGELLYLEQLVIEYGPTISLNSWLGPSGADQDFRLFDRWYEIKTIRPGVQKLVISSVEQLDVPCYSGELIVITLDSASKNEPGSFDPMSLVEQIRKRISKDIYALELFNSILEGFGFYILDEYRQYNFVLRQMRRFGVSNNFPLIKREELHHGINNVKYEIDLSALSSFEL